MQGTGPSSIYKFTSPSFLLRARPGSLVAAVAYRVSPATRARSHLLQRLRQRVEERSCCCSARGASGRVEAAAMRSDVTPQPPQRQARIVAGATQAAMPTVGTVSLPAVSVAQLMRRGAWQPRMRSRMGIPVCGLRRWPHVGPAGSSLTIRHALYRLTMPASTMWPAASPTAYHGGRP